MYWNTGEKDPHSYCVWFSRHSSTFCIGSSWKVIETCGRIYAIATNGVIYSRLFPSFNLVVVVFHGVSHSLTLATGWHNACIILLYTNIYYMVLIIIIIQIDSFSFAYIFEEEINLWGHPIWGRTDWSMSKQYRKATVYLATKEG